jgi:hypothetical protein
MKLCPLVLMLLVSASGHAATPFTNQIAFYVSADRNLWRSIETVKLDRLDLMPRPIIADSDFVAVDVTNQTFTTTADAAQRLNGQFHTSLQPILFVLVASGEPIGVGLFEPQHKAYVSLHNVPIVKTDPDSPTNRVFWIEQFDYRLIDTNTARTNQPIESGTLNMGLNETNILNDPRIISAIQKMFVHEKK